MGLSRGCRVVCGAVGSRLAAGYSMIIPTSLRPPDSAPMQTEVLVAVKTPREAAEAAEGDARFLLQLLATECRWLVNAMYDYPPGLDVPSEVTIYLGAICYIYFEVQRAREFLAETDRLLEAAADGLRTMGRAVAACPTTPSNVHLHQRLLQAEICVRDVAVWRCQMTVPFDNRDAFRLRLSEVFFSKTKTSDRDYCTRRIGLSQKW